MAITDEVIKAKPVTKMVLFVAFGCDIDSTSKIQLGSFSPELGL